MIKSTEQKVVKFILNKKLIDAGDSILLELSGGADSVFLLEFLFKYKRRFNIERKKQKLMSDFVKILQHRK